MERLRVAIVGRPNVGKSALLNRLLGRRLAIVEDRPGTTRDRVEGEIYWAGRDFCLVDTGGLEPASKEQLLRLIGGQVRKAMAEAEVIVFLVDARDGLTATDWEIADQLRRSDKPVILAANKVDNERRLEDVAQFFELGMGAPLPVSAFHGTGTGELLDRVVEELPPEEQPALREEGLARVAIVGRPNVGKSLLLNAILGQERVVVSAEPGTTRDAVDTLFTWDDSAVVLVDTAGLRRRGRIEGGVERYSVMRAQQALERSDVALVVLAAPEGVTAQDTHVAGMARDAFKGVVLVVNKWDLAEGAGKDGAEFLRELRYRMRFVSYAPTVFTSALTGQGVTDLVPQALEVVRERRKRVATSQVNRVVRQAVSARPPTTLRGRQAKVLYVSQTAVAPPTFTFFVNDPAAVHFTYRRYLENRLREAFGFEGVPLRLVFRRRARGEEE